jgi:hypothetical protein
VADLPTQPLAGAVWHKSSHSNGEGNVCVEVAFLTERAALRDSKNPGMALVIVPGAWRRFRRAITER